MAKSSAFVADLPDDISAEALERLYAWGKSSCEKFDVHMNENGTMAPVVVSKKLRTARDHQRNLLTLSTELGLGAAPETIGVAANRRRNGHGKHGASARNHV